MKKVKNNILSFSNRIIAVVLAMLGFASSCGESLAEYGVPSADFIVKGTVTSAETNLPIPSIRVIMDQDTVLTNAQGNYSVVDDRSFPESKTYTLRFQDIDNGLNGSFNDLDTVVDFQDPVFTGGDGKWYDGEVSKTVNVKLLLKK
jgi:putative lipoprotein (rSAM/lipoprotein system)